MNYEESISILDSIKSANRVLLNCHRRPDPDSIGSALAMRGVITAMGKEVEIVCPSEELPDSVDFLEGYGEIKKGVDFEKFDYSTFDLFITLDSSSWDQVTAINGFKPKGVKTIAIDHHVTNVGTSDINLIDSTVTSTCEVLFYVFEDWGVSITKEVASALMSGIIGDTGAFRYPGVTQRTFEVVSSLMALGADKDLIIHKIYRSDSFETIKFYGEVLSRGQLDSSGKFFWSALPNEAYEKIGKPPLAKESAASMFAQVVEGTEFGFVAVEETKGKLHVSFRSRSGFDTSKIAVELGGGGHIYASGATVSGLPFDEAVKKVLAAAFKYAKKDN